MKKLSNTLANLLGKFAWQDIAQDAEDFNAHNFECKENAYKTGVQDGQTMFAFDLLLMLNQLDEGQENAQEVAV